MSQAPSEELEDVLLQARRCRDDFAEIAETIRSADLDRMDFQKLHEQWQRYYSESFQPLDRLLYEHAGFGTSGYEQLAPLAVSHYNTDRLFDVLADDIGSAPIGDAPVPERVEDLVAVSERLLKQLETAANMA